MSISATQKPPFTAASSSEISPLTDSNRRPPPYHFWVGIGGHGGASAGTFSLQIGKSLCVADVRACPRVLNLLYPSRTRVMLSILKTDNAWLNDQ